MPNTSTVSKHSISTSETQFKLAQLTNLTLCITKHALILPCIKGHPTNINRCSNTNCHGQNFLFITTVRHPDHLTQPKSTFTRVNHAPLVALKAQQAYNTSSSYARDIKLTDAHETLPVHHVVPHKMSPRVFLCHHCGCPRPNQDFVQHKDQTHPSTKAKG